jgi:hypothetical protein
MNSLKDNCTFEIIRTSNWNLYEIPVISETSNNEKIKCNFAEFKNINKWGYEDRQMIYRIIYDNKNLLWIGTQREPEYFVRKNDKIYAIEYRHKNIIIYNGIENIFENIIINNNMDLDAVINKNKKTDIHIDGNKIDLSEYFYKGFFYRGILWDRNWKKDISMIKNVKFNNRLLMMEIENSTYPHCGYILLDIEKNKVMAAKKY